MSENFNKEELNKIIELSRRSFDMTERILKEYIEASVRERKNIINDFEDFSWTDRNGGEPSSVFDEQYGEFIDKMREKYT